MPLWAAILGILLRTSRFTKAQWLGYGLIASGIALMLLSGLATPAGKGSTAMPVWCGQALLLLAAASWAIYSHAFKRSGLTPLQGAAIVAAWSFIIHLLLAAWFGAGLAGVTPHLLVLQLVVQGMLSGLIGIFSYGFAVTTLGAARAASFSALAPVLAAIGAAVLLGERPQGSDLAAIVLVTLGVALASNVNLSALSRRRSLRCPLEMTSGENTTGETQIR
jgi:drug/metabolite transporter (DMT)-like permease